MTAQSWAQAVREQVGLGRLLPLGGAEDGAWIAERAAAGALRRAAEVSGARVTALRVALADPDAAWSATAERAGAGAESGGGAGGAGSGEAPRSSSGAEVRYIDERARAGAAAAREGRTGDAPAAGPPPASALPPGALRITAECDAATDRPMTATADALRAALWRGAEERLGLNVAAVDIHVAGLLEGPESGAQPGGPDGPRPAPAARRDADAGAMDVAGLRTVEVSRDGEHAEVRIAVDAGHRALDVAAAVRARVPATTVSVLVTDVR